MARSEKNLTAVFTDTASAIRAKTGTTEQICPLDFADKINAIQTGGGGTGGGFKAYFEAGGRCGNSYVTTFDGLINYSDTEGLTDWRYMFSDSSNLTSVPNLDYSSMISASYMFNWCSSLTGECKITTNSEGLYFNHALVNTKIENVELHVPNGFMDVSDLFEYGTTSVKTAKLEHGKFIKANSAFYNCPNIESVTITKSNRNISSNNNTDYTYMCMGCSNLKYCRLVFDSGRANFISNCFADPNGAESRTEPLVIEFDSIVDKPNLNMNYAFSNNKYIEEIPPLDATNVLGLGTAFKGATGILKIHLTNISIDINISACTKMTSESLLEVLNNLATVTSTMTCTLGETNLAKLTDEDKAIATNKGWTLA